MSRNAENWCWFIAGASAEVAYLYFGLRMPDDWRSLVALSPLVAIMMASIIKLWKWHPLASKEER